MGVRIRRLTIADWKLLRALRLRALEQSPRAFLGDTARESTRPEGRWQQKCSDEYWFVADVGDVASGWSIWRARSTGPIPCISSRCGWIPTTDSLVSAAHSSAFPRLQ